MAMTDTIVLEINKLTTLQKRYVNDLLAEEKRVVNENNSSIDFKELMLMHVSAEKEVNKLYIRKLDSLCKQLGELKRELERENNNSLDRNVHNSLNNALYRMSKRRKVVLEGHVFGRKFAIIAVAGHPCAYIQILKEDTIECCEDLHDVHGGGTYLGKAYWNKTDHDKYVGWDYSHTGDYMWCDIPYGRRWTIDEIFDEIKHAVVILNKMHFEEDLKDARINSATIVDGQ